MKKILFLIPLFLLLILSVFIGFQTTYADDPIPGNLGCMLAQSDDGEIIEVCPGDPEWTDFDCPRSCW